jgi:hypothetical protein
MPSVGRNAAEDPRLPAGIALLGRTGAKSVQVRYHDDEEPTLWMAYAEWPHGRDCGAGMTPAEAVMRLCDQVMDGGTCAHCGRPSGVTDHWESAMPLAEAVCWYVFDPETKKFRRSCEGETTGRQFTVDPETGETVGRNDLCPCGSGEKFKRCHGR